jgi:transcriptional regulator with XRE-family HTH domain
VEQSVDEPTRLTNMTRLPGEVGREAALGAKPERASTRGPASDWNNARCRPPEARGRRAPFAAEAERSSQNRRARLAEQIRSARLRRGWTQEHLANQSGLQRLVVGRAERQVGALSIETLERISMALGLPLVVELGRDAHDDVADAGHLLMQELVLRLSRACGFEVHFELPTRPADPWRSIDVVIGAKPRMLAIQVECWNTIGDIGGASRSTLRKQAELDALLAATWGPGARVRSVWVVRATGRNRALIARYPEVFGARFPASSGRWVKALTTGSEPPDQPGLVWSTVGGTRLFAWRSR